MNQELFPKKCWLNFGNAKAMEAPICQADLSEMLTLLKQRLSTLNNLHYTVSASLRYYLKQSGLSLDELEVPDLARLAREAPLTRELPRVYQMLIEARSPEELRDRQSQLENLLARLDRYERQIMGSGESHELELRQHYLKLHQLQLKLERDRDQLEAEQRRLQGLLGSGRLVSEEHMLAYILGQVSKKSTA